jgi:hypothetical protein
MMRNDARPIGEHAPPSPLGGTETRPEAETAPPHGSGESPIPGERPDSRDTVGHGRESHIVNRPAENREPPAPGDPVRRR